MLYGTFFKKDDQLIMYSEFVNYLEEGRVERVEVKSDRLLITLFPEEQDGEAQAEQAERGEQDGEVQNGQTEVQSGRAEPDGEAQSGQAEQDSESTQSDQSTHSTQEPDKKPKSIELYTGRMPDPELRAMLQEHGVEYFAPIVTTTWQFIFSQIFVPVLFIVFIVIFFRHTMGGIMGGGGRGGFMSIGQSNAKVYMEKKTGVTFEDVAGQEEAKDSLTEIVDFLHNPEKYAEIGATQPKGALLVGPPGTGKTLLAKAVAGEAGVVFFSLSGSDFVEMFVGVGASRVRDLFKQASQQSPCIIFIDEIDAIGKSRDNQLNSNDEREQTLNQLLAEMDGFDSSNGVVILGATNRPEILDKALLRPGRFDRRINVELPDLKGRVDILNVHAKKVKISETVDLRRIAMITPGAAGADLANMINEAALHAVRMKRAEVLQEDLLEAVEVVIAGKEKKDRIMTEKEKRIVAYHEVGHALARTVQKDAKPVEKITIVPRTKGSLGYVLAAPEEEKFMHSKDEMLAEIVVLMAGRAAEEIQFDTKTTGASNDIEKATSMARSMVSMYGMSEKFGMMGLESVQNRYLDARTVLNVSEQTGAELDSEVRAIIEGCYARALELLAENKDKLNEIAEYLFNKETITGEEFMELYNKPLAEL
ncbi:MAG: ATP-dependent zinc metalloprotease FtsH [Defluviitaleaceae bacterium]|nr:ATP-dependent zinc metalloprotease FtsH [Defluviitaleaceae bacterium]